MKVNIVARPDHSLKMYSDIMELLDKNEELNLFTFYALRQGSLLNRLFPKLKVAPETSFTLDFYTIVTRLANKVLRKVGANVRENESFMFELLAPKRTIQSCEVLHYWPFYCADMIKRIKKEKDLATVAEFYEAEPSYVNELYATEYERYGLSFNRPINMMIDQNMAFSFEDNFIVASEFTRRSYAIKYPEKKYYVCKYGPAGYLLDDNAFREISKRRSASVNNIVYVGQVCLEKGVHYLLDAVKGLNVDLHLIGPIREGQETVFNKLLARTDNVKWHGAMRHTEVLNKLSEYDAFCLPSLADNYSLAVVEALSKGMPVIVTANCGNADDVQNFNLGMVTKVKDAASIRECIIKLKTTFDYVDFESGLRSFFSETNRNAYPQSVLNVYRELSRKSK
ncbi:hypothetical protein PA25_26140 [Pseudoalteromonas sp. A25]|uniref:glycosyltransferase family 4 protein n=1 Tax=Pseudoalteromonas sp. A25 TaxID=116092 RepID=UPI0012608F2B|nr:glycosyltransferase [Pseudoalteromonas sp. A25]BBN82629.1 hypothetical protein PA25_26140 [Pseudoalteromonas sp. A25]